MLSLSCIFSCIKTEKIHIKGRITFATHRSDVMNTLVRQLADKFEKIYPGTKINIVSPDENELQSRYAANDLTDIIYLGNFSSIGNKLEYYFEPLNEIGFTKEKFKFYYNGQGKDGKLYLISNCINYDGFVYNKKVFKKAGIKKIPRTKQKFFETCKKIKKIGVVPVAINFDAKWTLRYYSQNNYSCAMLNISNYLGKFTDKKYLIKKNEPLIEGLNFLKKIVKEKYAEKNIFNSSWSQSINDMANGKIAMMLLGSWFPPQIIVKGLKTENIGMFPIPQAKAVVSTSDQMYGISRNSKNLELAKTFFKFLFLEGRFAKKLKVIPPNKDYKLKEPYITELLDYNLPVIEKKSDPDLFEIRLKKSKINLPDMTQEYVISDKPLLIIKKYNKKWEKSYKEK